jgi:hypothetical protein
MPPAILYCRKCSVGYGSVGEVPRVCPACVEETTWTTAPKVKKREPRVPWTLSTMDARFLRSIRIDAELADRYVGVKEKP